MMNKRPAILVLAAGRATGLVLHQGGQDLPAKKIKTP